MSTDEKSKLRALEAVRGLAALYVFIHHAQLLPNKGVGAILYFGQEAVILFFLLSGFVINFSQKPGAFDAGRYVRLRIRRIYPIFLLCLFVSYLAVCLIGGGWAPVRLQELIGNIFMLQDVAALKRGVWFDTYQGNLPLWSLSYEWWFYLLFIPFQFFSAEGKHRLSLAAAISWLGWAVYQLAPNAPALFLSYYIIWWAGVELSCEYIATGKLSFSGQKWVLASLMVMAVLQLVVIYFFSKGGARLQLGIDPVLQFRHYMSAFVFCSIAIFWQSKGLRVPGAILVFSYVAPISYGLYVVHQPILNVIDHLVGSPVLALLAAAPVVVLVSWLLEVKIQRVVNRMWKI